jgi:hypothetical protein
MRKAQKKMGSHPTSLPMGSGVVSYCFGFFLVLAMNPGHPAWLAAFYHLSHASSPLCIFVF